MKIEILGTGCQKCKRLFETVEAVVKEAGVSAEVKKIDRIQDIIDYGVMVTPALVIDGELKSAGRMPSSDEIKSWLKK